MLQNIRDKSTGIASKIFIALIVLVFALFGIDSLVGTLTNDTTAVSVNGSDIDEVVVESETQRKTQELAQSLGENIDISAIDPSLIREAAINDLIEEELLSQSALDSGMIISSQSLDKQIAQTPDFQVGGVFDNVLAQTVLQNYGYTPNSYRTTIERERLLNQLVIAYSASSFTTPLEMERAAEISLQKRNLRYLLLSQDGLAAGIEISDTEIEEYYAENQNSFMREEQVSLEYIALDKNEIYEEIEVSDEAIQAQYELQLEEYESQIERRASHILLEAFSDDEFLATETMAQELKDRIDAGESFEDLAAEYSTDLGSAADGGDVGYTTGDNFVIEFEAALQALDINEVSPPVKTEFGYHLIKLTEQTDTEIESLDDAKENISRDLQANQVDNLYLARAEELNNLSFESLDLNDPAEILNLEKQSTEMFGRSGGIGIAANSRVIDAAFGIDVLEDALNSELIQIDDSLSVVVRLLSHTEAAVMPLSEVQGEIDVLLRAERVREQVRSTGETIMSNINNGQNINGLLAAQQLAWVQIDGLQRSSISLDPELIAKAFTLSKPENDEVVVEGFQLDSGEYVVVELQEVIPGSVDGFSGTEADSLKNFITQQTGQEDFNSFVSGIQNRAKITR